MDYRQSKEWLASLKFAMKDFDLKTTKKLVKEAKIDLEKLKTIHIAGSNGKGSTAKFIATILEKQGYKTGLYTSPHLSKPTERMQINGAKISTKKFAELAERFKKIMQKKKIRANYFEVITAMALKHFHDEEVDFLVAETGLGGKLDATNVLKGIVNVITDISLEHTQFLGNTIPKIAGEKAGIIKPKSITVIGEKNRAKKFLKKKARAKKSMLIEARWKIKKSNMKEQVFDYSSKEKIKGLKIKMLGKYQCENASLAVAATLALKKMCFPIEEKKIREGLLKTIWPGRMEIIKKKPLLILDAAHNSSGWENLFTALKIFDYNKLIVVFGCMKDKKLTKAKKLLAKADELILTKTRFSRSEEPSVLRKKIGFGEIEENTKKALKCALEKAGKKDLVLITGSIYMVGEAGKKLQLAFL